ncbi:MAG: hypothetical protein HY321_07760 [Armatimonadetes bacterium]|nr:hypothetical protein [Armatimonadota bacterium]
MDVTRSISTLRRVSVGLRVVAWLVLAAFFAGAVGLASKLAVIGQTTDTVEQFLPFATSGGGVVMLVTGVITWLCLLCLAEAIMVLIAIEDHTRQAALATKAAKESEKVAAGVP